MDPEILLSSKSRRGTNPSKKKRQELQQKVDSSIKKNIHKECVSPDWKSSGKKKDYYDVKPCCDWQIKNCIIIKLFFCTI